MSNETQDKPAGANPPAGAVAAEHEPVVEQKNRKPLLIGLAIAVVVIGVLYFLYDEFIGSRSVSTDNAYVQGEVADVTPLTSGRVVDVMVTDTQPVRKGQILFRIEDSDQRIALAQAQAEFDQAVRKYGQSLKNNAALTATADANEVAIESAIAQLASANATLDKAQTDFNRRQALAGTGAVSADEVTAARQALASAKASQQQAKAGVDQARASADSARRNEAAAKALTNDTTTQNAPEIQQAKAKLDSAKLDLSRTVVRAPIDGIVSQRTIQVGQKVDNGATAMIIVPIDQLYVNANFKENQLEHVRSGQKAELTSDLYGGSVVYHGKVVGFSGGTGSAFALIPAQNATGNWIKVVQRLPVRIELDPKELRAHPLRIGLSMDAEVDLTDGN
ncbi:efflux RND transporter periplasmic adaptor subunit [Novosphingobium sp. 9]|uniref:HlyD family secretion protein n=1 Tax=Novosphingobium sp. 9 TaxID=2025349 RepID=UPI0021B5C2A2|nr:efflux RND transporter periplasmic adaptor subunit [Novosphingobium sp. 9]